jgi:hypothetical protein
MAGIPTPPDCSHCGDAIGLWEPVVLSEAPAEVPLTWLQLVGETDTLPTEVWHPECRAEGHAARR